MAPSHRLSGRASWFFNASGLWCCTNYESCWVEDSQRSNIWVFHLCRQARRQTARQLVDMYRLSWYLNTRSCSARCWELGVSPVTNKRFWLRIVSVTLSLRRACTKSTLSRLRGKPWKSYLKQIPSKCKIIKSIFYYQSHFLSFYTPWFLFSALWALCCTRYIYLILGC